MCPPLSPPAAPATTNDGPATVLCEVDSGVATITLNRPEALNSLDLATKESLLSVVRRVADDEAVRCVVLTGAGRGFCAGQDLVEHAEVLRTPVEDRVDTVAVHYNPIVATLASMAKPVLAAVNGIAAGAGASLAMACDLRLVADTAGFNLAFAGVALSCDTGASATLAALVGRDRALELLYLPRTVGAAEALELGLATRVLPAAELTSAVTEIAVRLAAGPTLALGAIRRSVSYAATHPFEQALEFEREMMALTGASEDHARAVAAFLAKQRPVFEGR